MPAPEGWRAQRRRACRHAVQATAQALGGCETREGIGADRQHHGHRSLARATHAQMLVAIAVGENDVQEVADPDPRANVAERLHIETFGADTGARGRQDDTGRRQVGSRDREPGIEGGGGRGMEADAPAPHQGGGRLVGADSAALHAAERAGIVGAIVGVAAEIADGDVGICKRVVPGLVRGRAPVLLRRHRNPPKHGPLRSASGDVLKPETAEKPCRAGRHIADSSQRSGWFCRAVAGSPGSASTTRTDAGNDGSRSRSSIGRERDGSHRPCARVPAPPPGRSRR